MSENADFFSDISKYDYGTYKKSDELQRKPNFLNHIIQTGDTLTSIAIKYSVSTGTLKQFNNMFSNEISFMSAIKIPVEQNSDIKAAYVEQEKHLAKPDLIKDYIKNNQSSHHQINIQTNNSFLDKMDQEILKAKLNLDKLNQRSFLKDLQHNTVAQSHSTQSLQSVNKNPNSSRRSRQLDVHIQMPQEHFQNSRYPYYNETFKDNFYDL